LTEARHPQRASRTFPAHPSALARVRTFLRERAAAEGLSRDLSDEILLAASEASANAVLHSGSPSLRISWRTERDRIVVEVADDGEFTRRIPLGPPEPGGRGIAVIMALSDEVTIREGNPGGPGTVVRMVKYLSA
jgi:anti-sigma regulatory factor (Ser/Thr protein kinase)